MSKVILGLCFGDEAKGLTTSWLCSQTPNPLVVRFNGGHQAGHTVVYEGKRHVFSGIGSGALQVVPTYWSKYCTFYPPSFMREYDMLAGYAPKVFVNPLCPVTTPFDIDYNRNMEKVKKHGSVGMGFGATIQRQEDYFKLFVQDLYYEPVLIAKLKNIAAYYRAEDVEEQIEYFLKAVRRALTYIKVIDDSILSKYNPIFEGAQGILLDMDFGFFPNVTRSNTTSKNALQMAPNSEIYYVMRSYLTRHGNGYMPNEEVLPLINNDEETNKSHAYQGEFRTAKHDIGLLNYALQCDYNFSKNCVKNLVISCMDQYEIDVPLLLHGLQVKFNNVYVSRGPSLHCINRMTKPY